jgi:hypothetical protein
MKSRKRIYLTMMGICGLLYLASWTIIASFSTTWAVIVSLVASVIPPVAVIIANRGADVP